MFFSFINEIECIVILSVYLIHLRCVTYVPELILFTYIIPIEPTNN